jgi:hypothetical protein
LDRREWVFEIAAQSGDVVLKLPFVDAVEPDLPDPDDSGDEQVTKPSRVP